MIKKEKKSWHVFGMYKDPFIKMKAHKLVRHALKQCTGKSGSFINIVDCVLASRSAALSVTILCMHVRSLRVLNGILKDSNFFVLFNVKSFETWHSLYLGVFLCNGASSLSSLTGIQAILRVFFTELSTYIN